MNNNYKKVDLYIKGLKKEKVLALILNLLYLLGINFMIVLVQSMLDKVTSKKEIDSLLFLQYGVYLFVFFVIVIVSQYFFRKISISGVESLKVNLYKLLLKKPISYFDKHNGGEVSSLFQNEISSVGVTLTTLNIVVIGQFFSLIITIGLLLYYNIYLTLIICFIMSACFFATSIIGKKQALVNKKIFEKKGMMNNTLLESVKIIKTIKILGRGKIFAHKYSSQYRSELIPQEIKNSTFSALYISIYLLLSLGLPLITIGIGVLFVQKGILTIGALIAVYALVSQAQEAIRIIADSYNERKSAEKLADRIVEVLEIDNLYKNQNNNNVIIGSINNLEVNMKSFFYKKNILLENLSFKLNSKDILLIEGESGSGKSTLLSIIMQFIEIENGKILFNGLDGKTLDINSLYENLLIVSQENILMEGTILSNISFFEEYTKEEVDEVIAVCQLKDCIEEHGLDYYINYNSHNLSGGQIQRICLARMLIRKPSILLLDEPTSALDKKTGELFSKGLKDYSQRNNMILCIVSHKPDIVGICNKRIMLK